MVPGARPPNKAILSLGDAGEIGYWNIQMSNLDRYNFTYKHMYAENFKHLEVECNILMEVH